MTVILGSSAQSVTGFGTGLATLPTLAAFAPQYVPGGLILMSVPLAVSNIVYDRRHIDTRAAVSISVSRVFGVVAGVGLLTLLNANALQAVCLAAALLSLLTFADPKALNWMSWWPVAGLFSGFMGAVAGVGGPPLAAAFRKLPLASTRATSGVVMLLGSILTLTLLALADNFGLQDVFFALAMVPLMIIGTIGGRRLFLHHAEARSTQAIMVMVGLGCLVLGMQVAF